MFGAAVAAKVRLVRYEFVVQYPGLLSQKLLNLSRFRMQGLTRFCLPESGIGVALVQPEIDHSGRIRDLVGELHDDIALEDPG